MTPNKFLIEGIDRLGKSTLISNIQHKLGYHQVLHFSKPLKLECYGDSLRAYQEMSFRNMFTMLSSPFSRIICDRAHLGEDVYSPFYRQYPGDYVFELEHAFHVQENKNVRLILLTEDFETSKHFLDDGDSLGPITARAAEQARFVSAFEKSIIADKRAICVTDQGLGGFRTPRDILAEALG
jgi:thymidylate kinase